MSLQEVEETSGDCPQSKRPLEDTGNRWVSANQGE